MGPFVTVTVRVSLSLAIIQAMLPSWGGEQAQPTGPAGADFLCAGLKGSSTTAQSLTCAPLEHHLCGLSDTEWGWC